MASLVLAALAAFNASHALLLGSLARSQAPALGIGVLGMIVVARSAGAVRIEIARVDAVARDHPARRRGDGEDRLPVRAFT